MANCVGCGKKTEESSSIRKGLFKNRVYKFWSVQACPLFLSVLLIFLAVGSSQVVSVGRPTASNTNSGLSHPIFVAQTPVPYTNAPSCGDQSLFSECLYNRGEWYCILGEPWTKINICTRAHQEFTDNPNGLNLNFQGIIFPGPGDLAAAAGPGPVGAAITEAKALGLNVPTTPGLLAAAALPQPLAEAACVAGSANAVLCAVPFACGADMVVCGPLLGHVAVLADIACGGAGFSCSGSDIISNFLAHPKLQKLSFNIWTIQIGWSKPVCTPTSLPDDICLPSGGNLQFGSAGVNNLDAQQKCATGRLVHLAITWDGDIHTDLGPLSSDDGNMITSPYPDLTPLVNIANVKAGMIKDNPSLAVELPLGDRGNFPNIKDLRGNQILRVCGYWVTDANKDELWNELHPVTSLSILPDFSMTSGSSTIPMLPGQTADPGITVSSHDGFQGRVQLTAGFKNKPPGSTPPIIQSFDASISLTNGQTASPRLVLSVGSSTTPNTYNLVVNGTSPDTSTPSDQHSVSVAITVPAGPDFRIRASRQSLALLEGSQANSTITLDSLNGLQGIVTLETTSSYPCPAGMPGIGPCDLFAIFPSNSVFLSSGGSTSVNMTVNALGSREICIYPPLQPPRCFPQTFPAPPGGYVVMVKGTFTISSSDIVVRYWAFTVDVSDFSIEPSSPISVTCDAGVPCSSPITATGLYRFTGDVTLLPSTAPSGMSCNLGSTIISVPRSRATSISCVAQTPRDYVMNVNATMGNVVHVTDKITFHVVDFRVTASTSSISLDQDTSRTSTLTLTPLNGFTGNLALTASVDAGGASVSLNPDQIVISSSSPVESVLTFKAIGSGIFTVTIKAARGGLSHIVSQTYNVNPVSNPAQTSNTSNPSNPGANLLTLWAVIAAALIAAVSGVILLVRRRRKLTS